MYPFKPQQEHADGQESEEDAAPSLKGLAGKTWFAKTRFDAPRNKDGTFRHGWHWNMPYSVKRDLPDWYQKEVERYSY